MRYFSNKSKEELLNDISYKVNCELGNDIYQIDSNPLSDLSNSLRNIIYSAVTAGFKELLDNMEPDTVIDDILLKDEDNQ